MRTTIIILLFALICVAAFARHDFDNRRRFRSNGDDENVEADIGDDNWGDAQNNENNWDDPNEDDQTSWRRRNPKKHHNHHHQFNDEPEDFNAGEDNNAEVSNTHASNTKSSNTRASNTRASNTRASNTQAASSSTAAPEGHLRSDTFASTDYNADSKFKQQCLDIHNDERAALGINPVTYNDDLATAAKAWAEQLVEAGSLSHSPNRVHVGENVGYRTHHDDVDSTPLLIGAWIAEKQYFINGDYPDISTTGSPHDDGHYSQLIWGTTKEIGCAVVNGDDRDYMVCQYAPSGNRRGEPVY